MKRHAFVPVLLLASVVASNAPADTTDPHSFWSQKQRGWFFYEDPPEPPEEAPAPPPPEPQSQTIQTITEAPAQATPAPPQAFSAEWFRKNLPKYKDAAWDNPTVENVRAFMMLQRYAMDRSSQFADVTQLAVQGDPFLDETARRPNATYAAQALDKQAGEAKAQVLGELAKSVGVFYFYASDCDLCQAQVPVVRMLESRFTVTPISVDGKDLPGSPFPTFKPDKGHAKLLGVQRLPAIYLAHPNGQFAPIAQGALALGEIEQRITLAAASKGWIDQRALNRTRPLRNLDDNLSELLPAGLVEGDENGFIPPAELLQHIDQSLDSAHAGEGELP
ncbi:conjugal transfer protein TraF [Pseudomonas luteola]|uniref:conjugal transfer protein TraF n=1 Tax=Pseudomonas luteola TaxID=47886 RepID=UPI00289E4BE2|nr:conjugal transfer protein TraF [Pseudomonas luteola]